jgi:hypothetical protein
LSTHVFVPHLPNGTYSHQRKSFSHPSMIASGTITRPYGPRTRIKNFLINSGYFCQSACLTCPPPIFSCSTGVNPFQGFIRPALRQGHQDSEWLWNPASPSSPSSQTP